MLFYVLTRLITDGLVRVHAAGQGYLTDWGVSYCPGNCCWLGYKPLAGVLAEGESLAGVAEGEGWPTHRLRVKVQVDVLAGCWSEVGASC